MNAKDKTDRLLEYLHDVQFETVSPWPAYKFIDKQGNIPFRYYNYDNVTNIFSLVSLLG